MSPEDTAWWQRVARHYVRTWPRWAATKPRFPSRQARYVFEAAARSELAKVWSEAKDEAKV